MLARGGITWGDCQTVLTEDLRSFDMKNISEVMRRNLRNLFMENYFFYLQIEFL